MLTVTFTCDACGHAVTRPGDDELEAEHALTVDGWTATTDGRHYCPVCAPDHADDGAPCDVCD